METREKLSAVRAWLAAHQVDAVLVPVHDEWLNEYSPACNRRVEWLSGFSGSAGLAVVCGQKAALFVDGRYTLQAQAEVDGQCFEVHNSGKMKPEEWLGHAVASPPHPNPLPGGEREYSGIPQSSRSFEGCGLNIAYDPALFTAAMMKRYQNIPGAKLVSLPCPVDGLWAGRPAPRATPLAAYPIAYAGETSSSKRKRMGAKLGELGADAAVITAPDSVCWLLNVRADDVAHTPLLLAPLILNTNGEAQLFVEASRVSAEVAAHLGGQVVLRPPQALKDSLMALGGASRAVLLDPQTASVFYRESLLAGGAKLVERDDPCQLAKATKNDTELEGIRRAHQTDGAAVVRLLFWLQQELARRAVSEMDVVEQLLEFRKRQREFTQPSFETIAGSGANGAIVHYRANEKTNRTLGQGELFLLDSGGQYLSGTTDITRTIAIGEPSAEQREHFTRVLKGHIALATAHFPEGTAGSQLDALARQYLWQAGLDYDHGTGHGVGCYLGVHEGPQRISKRGGDAPLAPGMILSNEPGYYREGAYGIRIENLVAVRREKPGWLAFETLTCAPMDRLLMDRSLLTASELNWLNAYHDWVRASLRAGLDAREQAWLDGACAAL